MISPVPKIVSRVLRAYWYLGTCYHIVKGLCKLCIWAIMNSTQSGLTRLLAVTRLLTERTYSVKTLVKAWPYEV